MHEMHKWQMVQNRNQQVYYPIKVFSLIIYMLFYLLELKLNT
jgi:hypothetical protein